MLPRVIFLIKFPLGIMHQRTGPDELLVLQSKLHITNKYITNPRHSESVFMSGLSVIKLKALLITDSVHHEYIPLSPAIFSGRCLSNQGFAISNSRI